MVNSPKIKVTKTRKQTSSPKTFPFSQDMVRLPESSPALRKLRQESWKMVNVLDLPSTQKEAWRRTDLMRLNFDNFEYYSEKRTEDDFARDYSPLIDPENCDGYLKVTSSGSEVQLADILSDQGVVLCDLRTAERDHPGILERIAGRMISGDEDKFAAMAAALAQNGILLYVPQNVAVSKPIYSLIWVPGVNKAHFSHVVIYIDNGASATFIHEIASPKDLDGETLFSGNYEVFLGDGAKFNYLEFQSLGSHMCNITHECVQVERNASIEWMYGAVGSGLSKNFLDLDLIGEHSSGKLSGFYFSAGKQHMDIDTQQRHLAPMTKSDLLFNGVLLNNSRVIWQGMVIVSPDAYKSDGFQMNRNIIIHDTARIDSIPGLEILTDDVRCSHGTTTGRINPEQLFYLQSRGISQKDAEQLIIEGFFASIFQRAPELVSSERLGEIIQKKFIDYY